MDTYTGQCACGALRYSFTGEPINSAFCYCTDCQVHTGSDKWFGVWVGKDNFTFTAGAPTVFSRTGDSGSDVVHQFCATCGTTVCIDVTVAGIYSVAAATLDGCPFSAPSMAIYTASAPTWATFPANVPTFDILPPEFSG